MPEELDSGTLNRAIATEMASVETSVSLSQKVLVISEDRLELSVRDGIEKIRKSDAWVAPLGIFISCIAAALTSNFQDRFYLSKEVWHSLFILGSIVSFLWLVQALASLKKFNHENFMALIRNKSSKQRIVGVASSAVQALTNTEIPITVRIQCSQCGYAIETIGDSIGPRICGNCKAIN